MGTTLFSVSFIAFAKPFAIPLLNRVDFMNECFLLLTTYYMFLTAGLVTDLELGDAIGWKYFYTPSGGWVLNPDFVPPTPPVDNTEFVPPAPPEEEE